MLVGLTLLAAGTVWFMGWFMGAQLAGEVNELRTSLPRAWRQRQGDLQGHAWGRQLTNRAAAARADVSRDPSAGRGLVTRPRGWFAGGAEFATDAGVILFVAAAPGTYVDGVVRLVPRRHRPAVRETAGHCYDSELREQSPAAPPRVPLPDHDRARSPGDPRRSRWAPLGENAFAVCTPEASSGGVDPHGINQIRTTPPVQQRAASLPRAVLPVGQVLAGTWAGLLGLVLAAPLIAGMIVVVNDLYVGRAPGDRDGGPPTLRGPVG